SGNGSFAWAGPNGCTSSEQNPTVSEAGNYYLTVTGANGGPRSALATVELDSDAPGATAQGGTLTCDVTSIQLQGSGNGSFAWSRPDERRRGEENSTVSEPGTYYRIVTGSNGFASNATANVEAGSDATRH